MNFKQAHSSNFKSGRTGEIKYIVIHYTSNDNDTAKNNVDYYAREPLETSAHYYVDKNEVWQSVKEGDTAYHCGAYAYQHPYCRNSNSIGIELCSRYTGNIKKDKKNNTVDFNKYYFEDAVVSNAVNLTKELMEKYNIPIDRVIRHYDVTGKTCPAPFVTKSTEWDKFKSKLTQATVQELTTPNDIVWELGHRGIVTDTKGMLEEMNKNPNGRLYWLARKALHYIRTKK